MLLYLKTFTTKGKAWKDPELPKTTSPEEVAVIREGTQLAIFYDGGVAYVSDFAVDAKFRAPIRRLAKSMGVKGHVRVSRAMRALLLKEVRHFPAKRTRVPVYLLSEYCEIINKIETKLLPICYKTFLFDANNFFSREQRKLADDDQKASLVCTLFRGYDSGSTYNIDKQDIINSANAANNSFCLGERLVEGRSVSRQATNLATTLVILAYFAGVPEQENYESIHECHRIARGTRYFKKGDAPG